MTTDFPTFDKPSPDDMAVRPNLVYDEIPPDFRWENVYEELAWLPGGFLNKAVEAIDRHAEGSDADKPAMIWEGKNGEREVYTFGQMKGPHEPVRQRSPVRRHPEGR